MRARRERTLVVSENVNALSVVDWGRAGCRREASVRVRGVHLCCPRREGKAARKFTYTQASHTIEKSKAIRFRDSGLTAYSVQPSDAAYSDDSQRQLAS